MSRPPPAQQVVGEGPDRVPRGEGDHFVPPVAAGVEGRLHVDPRALEVPHLLH